MDNKSRFDRIVRGVCSTRAWSESAIDMQLWVCTCRDICVVVVKEDLCQVLSQISLVHLAHYPRHLRCGEICRVPLGLRLHDTPEARAFAKRPRCCVACVMPWIKRNFEPECRSLGRVRNSKGRTSHEFVHDQKWCAQFRSKI